MAPKTRSLKTKAQKPSPPPEAPPIAPFRRPVKVAPVHYAHVKTRIKELLAELSDANLNCLAVEMRPGAKPSPRELRRYMRAPCDRAAMVKKLLETAIEAGIEKDPHLHDYYLTTKYRLQQWFADHAAHE